MSNKFSIFGGKNDLTLIPKHEFDHNEAHVQPTIVPDEPVETIEWDSLSSGNLEDTLPSQDTDLPIPPMNSSAVNLEPTGSQREERRSKRRALISAPVRVRSIHSTHDALDETTTTLNASRIGILLETNNPTYFRNMDVMVTFPFSKSPIQSEQTGRVVRISDIAGGRRAIAIALGMAHAEEFISSGGRCVQQEQKASIVVARDPESRKPLVLALDAEASARESLKNYLVNEGYEVITVSNAQEAREVLNQCTPSLLIAEIEGDGMPGYDICSHCKATPRLQRVPVMLITSSAYPSDYANAHSLGAVVCMAKPYRQERLGHVVRLLAPPPSAKDGTMPPRPADPTRRHLGGAVNSSKSSASNGIRQFRLGRKS